MTLQLIDKENIIDNVWTFRFTPTEPLLWTAGQYVGVELPHENPDAEGTKRWFTNAAAPYEGLVQITTRVSQTTFKQALAALEPGAELRLTDTPEGDFIWEDTNRPKVFIAGGIGVTPYHSILKQRVHDNQPLNVTLVYGSRTPEVPFKNELTQWQAIDPQLQIKYVVGEPLTAAQLIEIVPGLTQSVVYVSGPEPMVIALSKDLIAHGLPEIQLKRDQFPHYDETNY